MPPSALGAKSPVGKILALLPPLASLDFAAHPWRWQAVASAGRGSHPTPRRRSGGCRAGVRARQAGSDADAFRTNIPELSMGRSPHKNCKNDLDDQT